jgi:hypothetical protein
MSSVIIIACLIPLLSVPVTAWMNWRRGDYIDRERGNSHQLLALPLIWIFIIVWGVVWHRRGGPANPNWVGYFVLLAIFLEFAAAIFLIWWLRGIRLFVAAFSLLNLELTALMAFLATMFISGEYL